MYFRNVPSKKKKNIVKKQLKVTTDDKAVQTIPEKKEEIDVEDLTCTSTFKIILFCSFFFMYFFENQKHNINFLLKYF